MCASTALPFLRHEKNGTFPGAQIQRKGRFELAGGGSLFLDEIGDISLELQPKLLRTVQEQEFEGLGSTRTIQVNVRVIAATHRDLRAMIQEEKFREDLSTDSTSFRSRFLLCASGGRTFRCW
jgi:transcriptional regulator with GAF, ATPase, and Fis domain